MNKIEFESIFQQMQELWPQWDANQTEYGLYYHWFKDHDIKTIQKILLSVAGESDFKPPRKALKEKLNLLPRPERSKELRWIYCYFVCIHSDGKNMFVYPGKMNTVCFPDSYSPDELPALMRQEAENWTIRYGFGVCTWEFFIGLENEVKARLRAKEIFTVAYEDHALPERFYRDYGQTCFGETYETQPGEVKEEEIPLTDDSIPF